MKCILRIRLHSISANNHFVESLLGSSFAAFFQGLFHVVSVAPYVNLAEVTVPPGKCQLHTGICYAGFHGESVVFLAYVHRISFQGKDVMQSGIGILHIWIATVCLLTNLVDVI